MTLKRLKKEEIRNICSLAGQGNSLNTISRKLNIGKTTVYYYIKEISKNKMNPIKINPKNQELIGEFMGLFAGDGNFLFQKKSYQYTIRLYFNIKEKSFVDNLAKEVLVKLFGRAPGKYRERNMVVLRYYSKEIYTFIRNYLTWDPNYKKTYTIKLIKTDHSKDFMIGFIRGSLDSDGYFSEDKISFASTSKGLICNISKFLDNFNIVHSVKLYHEKRENRKDIYHLNIFKSERERFIDLIEPRNIKV